MSAGGVFALIANDGKADRLIMATQLLNQRIKEISCARRAAGKADTTPTLADLERTHVLFMNAHFKPFAAIGYEYQKVKPQSGTVQLGSSVQFSIPQFGDFFHDMVGRQTLTSFYSSLQTSPTQGGDNAGTTQGAFGYAVSFPANGDDWDGATALAGSTYSLVDPFGNAVDGATPNAYRNMVRYCEYPGERLYQNVKFNVNGNPLDEYTDNVANMIRKFTIGANKITGYKRLVGQEVELEGYSGPQLARVIDTDQVNRAVVPYLTGANDTPANTAALNTPAAFLTRTFAQNAHDITVAGNAAAVNNNAPQYFDVGRAAMRAVRGPQTPKYWQASLEIWNKLRFWFNDDARLAIPSVSIPYGQRFIEISLATKEQMVHEFPGLFVQQVIQTVTDQDDDDDVGTSGTTRTVTYRPYWIAGTITGCTISSIELYVNNIFVNPEIHDIFIQRVGFSLIRVYRYQTSRTNTSTSDEKLLSQLKWPIEYMFVGFRPAWNADANNPNQYRDWHRFSKVVDDQYDDADEAIVRNLVDEAEAEYVLGGLLQSSIGQVVPNKFVVELPTVDSLSLTAHGVKINDQFPEPFFNSYVPFHYGGPNIVTPDDRGAMMVNFALYPGSYQPSGHINVSRAREFYLQWTTAYVDSATPADMVAIAIAINFLLITDGSAVLRYST